MKFYYNANLKWWAVSYEKDPSLTYIFLKGENPANTLISTLELEKQLGSTWEEVIFNDCILDKEEEAEILAEMENRLDSEKEQNKILLDKLMQIYNIAR